MPIKLLLPQPEFILKYIAIAIERAENESEIDRDYEKCETARENLSEGFQVETSTNNISLFIPWV